MRVGGTDGWRESSEEEEREGTRRWRGCTDSFTRAPLGRLRPLTRADRYWTKKTRRCYATLFFHAVARSPSLIHRKCMPSFRHNMNTFRRKGWILDNIKLIQIRLKQSYYYIGIKCAREVKNHSEVIYCRPHTRSSYSRCSNTHFCWHTCTVHKTSQCWKRQDHEFDSKGLHKLVTVYAIAMDLEEEKSEKITNAEIHSKKMQCMQ